MKDDELLRAYANDGSESAFTELVRRHAGAVQAAALRQTGNAHLAEEVTHAVFLQLARKAGSLRSSVVLLGWLLRAARYAAIDAIRAEARRQKREADFVAMQPLDSHDAHAETDTVWTRVAPLLDEALHRLREKDRNALLLRFFENKPLSAVGSALGVPEDAARKRVQRALERLHAHLSRQGAVASAAVLPGLLSARAAPASSLALVQATTRTALATSERSLSSTALLAAGLGRRLFWTAVRPWLIGTTALVLGAGTVALVTHDPGPTSVSRVPDFDDYRTAGFPDALVVRQFVAELQQRLGANRRAEIAGMIQFPLRINYPETTEFLSDPAALLAQFDAVFGPKTIAIIRKSPNRGPFCDAKGVMVGDGTVWIGAVGDPARPAAAIIALNLP